MTLNKKEKETIEEYCFSCGDAFTKKDIDGGRCSCGSSIASASSDEVYQEFLGADKKIQKKILTQIRD